MLQSDYNTSYCSLLIIFHSFLALCKPSMSNKPTVFHSSWVLESAHKTLRTKSTYNRMEECSQTIPHLCITCWKLSLISIINPRCLRIPACTGGYYVNSSTGDWRLPVTLNPIYAALLDLTTKNIGSHKYRVRRLRSLYSECVNSLLLVTRKDS